MANKEAKMLPELSKANIDGNGSRSSSHRIGVVDAANELISEGIKDKLDFKSPCKAFRIADLSYCFGPNTFYAVENIIEAVDCKYRTQIQNSPPLEFQVFFNDVASKDFNTLFTTLPPSKKYFAAGVPGTFYNTLLPKSTVHLTYSSYALHWLSKVPEEVVDSKSPAWNKGSIHCSGVAEAVGGAYLAQFRNDIDTFLNARAQEIVDGGLLLIIVAGLPDGISMSETAVGIYYDILGSTLIELAKLGVISEEKVDSFNLPLYYASAVELREIVKTNGNFSIEKLDTFNNPIWQLTTESGLEVALSAGRAVFQGILQEHFGSADVVDKIFETFAKKLADNSYFFESLSRHHADCFILLKRNC